MNKIYILSSGEKVGAKGPAEFVDYLRQQAGVWDDSSSVEDFMFKFSDRTLLGLHAVVRFDTPENFVCDLHKVGIISQIIIPN